MLKKAANFVLGSKASSMYPRGYTCGVFFACGRVGGLFEHPFGMSIYEGGIAYE
jgi:hypothetical protein